jgi:hypothetical protein
MSQWRDEQPLEWWNPGSASKVVVGLDSDGDLGLYSSGSTNYSIYLSPKGALQLLEWLEQHEDYFRQIQSQEPQ